MPPKSDSANLPCAGMVLVSYVMAELTALLLFMALKRYDDILVAPADAGYMDEWDLVVKGSNHVQKASSDHVVQLMQDDDMDIDAILESYAKQSDSSSVSMFRELGASRVWHHVGMTRHSQFVAKFRREDPVLLDYGANMPSFKTVWRDDVLKAYEYVTQHLHAAMHRVLALALTKAKFCKMNSTRVFWDALITDLMKPIGDSTKPPLLLVGVQPARFVHARKEFVASARTCWRACGAH
ncbi:hypothetical protein GGF32_004243 [Allomyces javanicus]|nr:hypothetical protein GGF32_004243 [Allomyces javanicus]